MPYIKEGDRERFKDLLLEVECAETDHPGELNYAITNAILQHVHNKGLNYATINEVMGVLSCVQKEFYRRVAVTYEKKKIEENGDLPLFEFQS